MNKQEMIKAFTELELRSHKPSLKSIEFDDIQMVYWVETYGFSSYPLMDAISNLGLNCAARDKYMTEISYHTQFDCGPDGSGSYDIPYATASIEKHHSNTPLNDISSEAICLVVIECILKSQGLWK